MSAIAKSASASIAGAALAASLPLAASAADVVTKIAVQGTGISGDLYVTTPLALSATPQAYTSISGALYLEGSTFTVTNPDLGYAGADDLIVASSPPEDASGFGFVLFGPEDLEAEAQLSNPSPGANELSFAPDYTAFFSDQTYAVNLTVSTATGVPEPGTWALILIGFGGLGTALRARVRLAHEASPAA